MKTDKISPKQTENRAAGQAEGRARLLAELETCLGEKRLRHVKGVAALAAELATRYGEDAEKAETAALFHDRFREVSQAEAADLAARYGLPAAHAEGVTAHGHLAAAYMEAEYGIADADTLNAARWHTTGRAGMSRLEMILYTADAAEPSRDHPAAAILRAAVETEPLETVCAAALDGAIRHVRETGGRLDAHSLRAREWLLERRGAERGTEKTTKERVNGLEGKELALRVAGILGDKKATDVTVIDISEKSSFADYFVIASGNSERQVGSLADETEKQLGKSDVLPKRIEGRPSSGWVLMDYGDVIVNVFSQDQRSAYRLEAIWGDGEFIPVES